MSDHARGDLESEIPRAQQLKTSRSERPFVAIGAAVVVVAAGVVGTWLVTRSTSNDGWVQVGRMSDFPFESATYVRSMDVFVVNAREGWFAIVNRSTHLDERLEFYETDLTFTEPHGSRWTVIGEYMMGPASSGLERHPIRVGVHGEVMIDPSTVKPGPPRGTRVRRPAALGCVEPHGHG